MERSPVLAIDDAHLNLLLLQHVLWKAGVPVDTAGSGEEGLRLAIEHEHPLIFLDILMPGMDGLEVCRRLRRHPFASPPSIVLMTSMGEQFSQTQATEARADGVFFKPVAPSRVLELARGVLGKAGWRFRP